MWDLLGRYPSDAQHTLNRIKDIYNTGLIADTLITYPIHNTHTHRLPASNSLACIEIDRTQYLNGNRVYALHITTNDYLIHKRERSITRLSFWPIGHVGHDPEHDEVHAVYKTIYV